MHQTVISSPWRNASMSKPEIIEVIKLERMLYFHNVKRRGEANVHEVFHVYLNKFENAVTHLFLVTFGNK